MSDNQAPVDVPGREQAPPRVTVVTGGFRCLLEGTESWSHTERVTQAHGQGTGLPGSYRRKQYSTDLCSNIPSQVTRVACFAHYSASASSSWWPTSPSRYAYTPCQTWTSFWDKIVSD